MHAARARRPGRAWGTKAWSRRRGRGGGEPKGLLAGSRRGRRRSRARQLRRRRTRRGGSRAAARLGRGRTLFGPHARPLGVFRGAGEGEARTRGRTLLALLLALALAAAALRGCLRLAEGARAQKGSCCLGMRGEGANEIKSSWVRRWIRRAHCAINATGTHRRAGSTSLAAASPSPTCAALGACAGQGRCSRSLGSQRGAFAGAGMEGVVDVEDETRSREPGCEPAATPTATARPPCFCSHRPDIYALCLFLCRSRAPKPAFRRSRVWSQDRPS